MNHQNSVSFVIPCLNEEKTLPNVLAKINQVRQTAFSDRDTEVIVSDNGSTDESVGIALKHGAKVIHCKERGYGAALNSGIRAATNDVIIFADADNTYDFLESPKLLSELEKGFDLVFGSRLKGTILKGAMPSLHRYLGTPVLNKIINALYSPKSAFMISDCNSGFRCFKKSVFLSWNVRSTGMEFASEMLVKAFKNRAKISDVPISLHPHDLGRIPHLKTWRDGMRHLLQILLEAPSFFYFTGSTLIVFAWIMMILTLVLKNPVILGFASIFGIHTAIFGMLGSCLGLSIWSIGLLLASRQVSSIPVYDALIRMSEDRLFWISFSFISISAALVFLILAAWALNGFKFLALEKETILISAFITNGLLLVFSIFTAHLMKRA